MGLADEAARLGVSSLLVDADVYGGVVAQVLGLLDDSPGLAGAARQAGAGTLDSAALVRLAWAVRPHLRVLTGLARADRWPELRPRAVTTVLEEARRLAELTVVDCAFNLEDDEELSFDTAAPRRNGATLAVLEAADTVVCVSGADPVALQRSVRALDDLREVLPDVSTGAGGQPGPARPGRRRPEAGDRRGDGALLRPGRRLLPPCRPPGDRRGPGRRAHARRGGARIRAARGAPEHGRGPRAGAGTGAGAARPARGPPGRVTVAVSAGGGPT